MEIKLKINKGNSLINAWVISNDKEISFESLPVNDKEEVVSKVFKSFNELLRLTNIDLSLIEIAKFAEEHPEINNLIKSGIIKYAFTSEGVFVKYTYFFTKNKSIQIINQDDEFFCMSRVEYSTCKRYKTIEEAIKEAELINEKMIIDEKENN